jgi:hypothetical protein
MYGSAARCKTDFGDDERESCINVFRPLKWSDFTPGHMGIRAHPG